MREENIRYWRLQKQRAPAPPGAGERLDTAVIGGIQVSDIIHQKIAERQIPPDVLRAFHQQYPNHGSFVAAVHRLRGNPERLNGLISGIKGKLFEDEYVAWLNHGHLPAGYHAELAHSANQPAWDIVVRGPHGHVRELLQLKATESASYIEHTLAGHPRIDVVTTHEIFQQAVAHSGELHRHLIDSGISLNDLNHHVAAGVCEGIQADPFGFHFPGLVLALCVITEALSFGRGQISLRDMAANIRDRSALAFIAGGCAWLAINAAGASLLGPPAAIAARVLGGWVRTGLRERKALLQSLARAEKTLQRLARPAVV